MQHCDKTPREVRPFPGHLEIEYMTRENRDPNWRDFDPKTGEVEPIVKPALSHKK